MIRRAVSTIPGKCLCFAMLLGSLLPACAPSREMSLEEAKQVTVSMSETPTFVPPPRRIDDITAILNQPGEFDRRLTEEFMARANAAPPTTGDKAALYRFYKDRGRAARDLGNDQQALDDLRLALRYAEEAKVRDVEMVTLLSVSEKTCGSFRRAIELLEGCLPAPNDISAYARLVDLYAVIGNVDAARKSRDEAMSYCRSPGRTSIRFWCALDGAFMEARILEAQGKDKEAEPYIRHYMKLFAEGGGKEKHPSLSVRIHMWLAMNLLGQRRLAEAEMESRKALGISIALAGKESYLTAGCLGWLGHILREEGRVLEAEQLKTLCTNTMERLGIPDEAYSMCMARVGEANNLFGKGDFSAAMARYEKVKAATQGNPYLYDKFITWNPDAVLSHLMTGRGEEALRLADRSYDRFKAFFGEKSWRTAAWLFLRGMAHYRLRTLGQAVRDMSEGMEGYLLDRPPMRTYSGDWRFKLMLDDYIRLLDEIRGTPLERELGRDATGEAFRLAEASRGQTVQWALSASSARAAVDDPDTADLIRREQDAAQQIEAIEMAIEEQAASVDQQDTKRIKDMQHQMATLQSARRTILAEIGKRFPKYVEIVRPRPASLSEVQNTLLPGEALISLYTTENRTYVWALPSRGQVRFASVAMGKKELQAMVGSLRRALDPRPQTLNDIPDFDVNVAFDLYRRLLEPVREGWKDAGDWLMIVNESLGQIPMGVLVTAPAGMGAEKGELFSRYRQVPWLIRKASITMLPSASSLVTLRALPPGEAGRRSFAGFGDPIFNSMQAAFRETGQEERVTVAGRGEGRVRVRGIRAIAQGDLDGKQVGSCQLERLNRLPDTADEIKGIAGTVGADPGRDVFLGREASERQVKTMKLSDRRIVAFATHGLVAGDLDGLDQPAIALSSPSVADEGDKEDGLLTMGEIMKLKLNADWVLLSACNTAAADGSGAEALSGLGRAFFYAGTRSVLASMYPVETTAARKLVTTIFQYQKEDQSLSRAGALRKSMLDLMDGPGLIDPASGMVVSSYAHPLFWAPFILVGDTGGRP